MRQIGLLVNELNSGICKGVKSIGARLRNPESEADAQAFRGPSKASDVQLLPSDNGDRKAVGMVFARSQFEKLHHEWRMLVSFSALRFGGCLDRVVRASAADLPRSAANTHNSVVHGFGGSMEAVGGRDGRTDWKVSKMLGFWWSPLGMEASRDSGASGSFWPRFHAACTQDFAAKPCLDFWLSTVARHHHPLPHWILDYSLDSRLPVLQCAAIPNSISFWRHHPRRTQSAALPIHPFVYRPENSRIHCPGRAATATFPRSHGSRFTPTPSHRPPPPGPPPTTPHTATAAQSCSHVDGLSLTWGQASLCGPESSLSFRLRMTFRLGCIYLLSQYIHEASPNRDSISVPVPCPRASSAQCPRPRFDNQPATCNLQLHLQAHRRPT